MMIELLIVGVILSYLYGAGYLELGDPASMAIAIGIILSGLVVGSLVTRWFAGHVVDGILGFSGNSVPKADRQAQRKSNDWAPSTVPVLEKMVQQVPSDIESSRRLAEAYLKEGQLEKFIAERTRIMGLGKLSREECVSALHRLADVHLDLGQDQQAMDRMTEIITKYPDGEEAALAAKRLDFLLQRQREKMAEAH